MELVTQFAKMFPEFNALIGVGIMIFVRFLGFVRFAPVLSRKEVPVIVKLSFTFLATFIFIGVLKPTQVLPNEHFFVCLLLNFVFGFMVGFIANCIFLTIVAAGDMMNMQMGLSSAMVLDPSTQSQTSVVGRFLTFLGIIIFIHVGGFYWLMQAFLRGFEVFPVYATSIPLDKIVNIEYLTEVTANVLFIGMQMAGPILLATLGQDIILGIISKTAPQVNVFQLSFLFKPVMGVAILLWIMPRLMTVIGDFFLSYARIF